MSELKHILYPQDIPGGLQDHKDCKISLIKIKTLESLVYLVQVDLDHATVYSLKQYMAKKFEYEIDKIRVICKGQPLFDDWSLTRCKVQDGDMLHFVVVMRGS